MALSDAVRDKIPFGKNKRGFTVYHPPCHICGKRVDSWNYIPGRKYTCWKCKRK